MQTIKAELNNASPCVSIWNDTAQQLLYTIQSADAERASNRLIDISERLCHLNAVCTSLLEQVESHLGDSIRRRVRVCRIFYSKEIISCLLCMVVLVHARWPTARYHIDLLSFSLSHFSFQFRHTCLPVLDNWAQSAVTFPLHR